MTFFIAGESWSYVGKAAKFVTDRSKCTMMLNIGVMGRWPKDPDNYKKYTVLHEAGHALGFGHEHQHPNLSGDTFNKETVISDLTYNFAQCTSTVGKTPKERAKEFYRVNIEKFNSGDGWNSEFDQNSVMKYRYDDMVHFDVFFSRFTM